MPYDLLKFTDEGLLGQIKPQSKTDYRGKLNLSSNELHSSVFESILQKFKDFIDTDILTKYPYYPAYIQEYAISIGLDSKSIIFTAGSDSGIYLLLTALTRKKSRIINFVPNYISYEKYSIYNNNAAYENVSFKQSFADIKTSLLKFSDSIVVLTNPNGFDGGRYDDELINDIADICGRQEHLLILDEAYAAFNGFDRNDLLLQPDKKHIVIVRSFSKCFGVAGLRLGCILADRTLIDYFSRWNPTNAVSSFSMAFFSFCLRNQELMKKVWDEICINKSDLTDILRNKSHVWPSYTNFVACQFNDTATKDKALELFHKRNTIVKDISQFQEYANSLRITVPSTQGISICSSVIDSL